MGILLHAALSAALQAFDEPYQAKLWKFTSAGNSVYLLGSIHAGSPDMYPLPKPVEDAFAASSVLLVEEYSSPSEPIWRKGEVNSENTGVFFAASPHSSIISSSHCH